MSKHMLHFPPPHTNIRSFCTLLYRLQTINISMDIDLVIVNDEPAAVVPVPGRERRSRNSWSMDGSCRGQSKRILGAEIPIGDLFKRRIIWAQRIISFCAFVAVLSYVFAQIADGGELQTMLLTASLTFGGMSLMSFGGLYYNNISFVIIRRLMKEVNVVIIIVLISSNLAVEFARPEDSFGPALSFVYMLVVYAYASSDALVCKSRYFIISIGCLSVALSIYNLYGTTFGDMHEGIVLLAYNVQNSSYTIMKRATKRSIHFQILLFSMNSLYTLFTDKDMELMIFATGNIYRPNNFLSNRMGIEQKRRSKWAEFGIGHFCLLALIFYILSNIQRDNNILVALVMTFSVIAVFCFACLFYRNVSPALLKRLLKEPNVVVIVILSLCNVIIEVVSPAYWDSQMMSVLYMLLMNAYVFSSALVCTRRYFVIFISIMSVALNIYNFYGNTFADWNDGTVLLSYSIQGKQYTIMRRSTKQAIYLQILLFSIDGVSTMLGDKKRQFIMFATGNIYRSSGTSSQDVCTSFANKVKSEMADKRKGRAIL